ncbi:type II secretion system F family protein [Armatimonas rosea]|uniref:Type II secretory pathway component PulF n=1 Tax=Armatimonas rosea TaxID=685828 RepID=A0A7W9SW71_ARMRO|nr:type II secretion system F family protein [Armatimonas rosea]MBB6053039.1 type II secretory pathway component PulF [Armatimonas rosea]
MAALSFSYVAMDSAGARRTGVIEAETKEAALVRLESEGRFVLEINEAKASAAAAAGAATFGSRKAPSRQELALFTRRLADLSQAGLPLDRVLQVVAEQSESIVLKEVSEQTLEDVRAGMQVSQALAKHPKYFNEVFTQTLRAGEASGQFPEVAGRLADFQEKEVARRSQITSALVYPAILASTAVFVVLFLLLFVVPKLSGVFKDLGNNLPVTTKMLLSSTDFITQNWVLMLVLIVGTTVGIKGWLATPGGAFLRDKFLLKAPLIGPVVLKATISRFARVLGTLVYGGVPILEALDIAGLSAGNRVFHTSAQKVSEEVREGRPIAESMRDTGVFPPVLTHMVAIGEETGDLPRMLGRVSDSLDFEVDTGMRRLVSLVEPVIVLTMGTFVGFVVLSVLLPIFQAQETVK